MAIDQLSYTFSALADPTRRAILARLALGETSVKELAEPFDMTAPAITKHLKILQRAGLISQGRQAQWRPCRFEPRPLAEATNWLEQYRQHWEQRLDQLDNYLKTLQAQELNMATNDVADREIIISRVLDAPRELVWEAWTNPKHADNWWGPERFINTTESMDFRVGGEWRYLMIGPDGTRYLNHQIFKEIIPPSKLVFDHGDGASVWFETTITLEETSSGTLVTLRQLHPDKATRDMLVEKVDAIEGGKQHLAKLEIYIKENLS